MDVTVRPFFVRDDQPDTPAAPAAALGGQAVVEGVMMRGPENWAVAVRLPETHPERPGEIAVRSEPAPPIGGTGRLSKLPILRGSVALVDSLRLGIAALRHSLELSEEGTVSDRKLTGPVWAGTVAAGLGLAVVLFFLLPAALTKLLATWVIDGSLAFVVVEKVIRLSVFIAYLWAVSRMAHLQRVFQYHGAEHQSISCYEAGLPLTPENAGRQSLLHPRCGTSFLLLVMFSSIIVFAPLGELPLGWLLLSRVLGIPLVAGIAYETIKWTARHPDQRAARVLRWPGMQLQRMTTREPTDEQREVALAALRAVMPASASAAPSQAAGAPAIRRVA